MRQKILLRLVAILALLFAVAGCVQSVPITVEQVDVTIPVSEIDAKPVPDDWATEPLRGYPSSSVYRTFGGAKLVANSGAEIEMLSGSTLDIQSGTTSTFGGDLDIEGTLTVDTINETTANNGVVVESVTILDGGLSATAQITTSSTISATGDIQTAGELVADVVTEAIAGTGVTVDSVLLKDGGADLTGDDLTFENDEYITNDQNGYLVLGISASREFTFSSTSLELFANELFLDADANTSLHADVDDQIDFTIGGGVDAVFAANLFQLSGGTVLEVDTINEETADAGVATEGVTHIDGGITVTANILLTGDFELDGVIRDTSGAVTIEKAAFIDGTADDVQLRVQASGVGQASNIIVIEDEDGNDGFRVNRIGATWISGTVTLANGDLDVSVGDLDVAVGDLSVSTGDATFAGLVQVGTILNLVPGTPIEALAAGSIDVVSSMQPITSTGNVGLSDITVTTAGDILLLTNTTNTTITITDTGVIMLSGNCALTQYDTLLMVSDGTNWLEISCNNN